MLMRRRKYLSRYLRSPCTPAAPDPAMVLVLQVILSHELSLLTSYELSLITSTTTINRVIIFVVLLLNIFQMFSKYFLDYGNHIPRPPGGEAAHDEEAVTQNHVAVLQFLLVRPHLHN